MNSILKVENLNKSFKNESILKDVNLNLNKGEVLSLLGYSGSGKTTLLKIIAGLEKKDKGIIILNDEDISDAKVQDRNIVYLYQDALLFPHLNVFENIAFGLRLRNIDKAIIEEKVWDMLDKLEMKAHAKKMSTELSGGQKQRISFGRAMVIEPQLLLLDEPFGALDGVTRSKMQVLFKSLAKKMNVSALFVTHDLKEAIVMGDEIARIKKGKLKQYATKEDFYNDDDSGVKKEVDFWKQFN